MHCPTLHVYGFAPEEGDSAKAEVLDRCRVSLGIAAVSDPIPDAVVAYVRNVSPNKGMYRATFRVPAEVLLQKATKEEEPSSKRTKVEEENSTA